MDQNLISETRYPTPQMPKPSILLLDFDGTLADSRESIAWSLRATLKYFDFPLAEERKLFYAIEQGWIAENTFRFLLPDAENISDKQIQEYKDRYRNFYVEEGFRYTKAFQGVEETISTLQRAGKQLAIVSNKATESIEKTIGMWGMANYFDFVVGDESCETKKSILKPEIACFDQRVVPFHKMAKEEYLMVGDTATDLSFARNCGIPSCWASYGYGSVTDCQAIQPDFTISTFPELVGLV